MELPAFLGAHIEEKQIFMRQKRESVHTSQVEGAYVDRTESA